MFHKKRYDHYLKIIYRTLSFRIRSSRFITKILEYEKASVIITSNKRFDEWAEMMGG